MGRIYVSDALVPALKEITKAYVEHRLTAEEIYDMAHSMAYGMACHKEEKKKGFPPIPLFTKEEKEENSLSLSKRGVADFSSDEKESTDEKESKNPTLLEVEAYGREIGATERQIISFYGHFEANEWETARGKRLKNWKARMRQWKAESDEKNEMNKSRNNGKGHSNTHAQSGREVDEKRELQEYLDTYYAVDNGQSKNGRCVAYGQSGNGRSVAVGQNKAAVEGDTLAARVSLLFTSGVYKAHMQSSYAQDSIVEKVKKMNLPTLKVMADVAGCNKLIHLMAKHLYQLGKVLDPNKYYTPRQLVTTAIELMGTGRNLTMDEMLLFLNKIRQGDFGRFNKGLYVVDMNVAMKKFMAWRSDRGGL